MITTEVKNFICECMDKQSRDAVVLYRVEFEIKESGGNWIEHSVEVMATDPIDAINHVRKEFK
jgi:hypothetical protein